MPARLSCILDQNGRNIGGKPGAFWPAYPNEVAYFFGRGTESDRLDFALPLHGRDFGSLMTLQRS
jgi:hypothetical protein